MFREHRQKDKDDNCPLRTFRLDRIVALESGQQFFERPEDFDALRHVLSSIASWPGTEQVEVVMKTTMERARQAIPPDMGMLEESAQGVIFRRAAYQLEWVALWLICLDFPVVVVQPVALREMLRQMVARALQMVGDES